MVVWESEDQDGDGWGVYGKSFSMSNNYEEHTSEFRVSLDFIGDQYSLSIDGSTLDHRFAVVWRDSTSNIFCAVLNHIGEFIFAE